jgi:uncharacterized membrane-anchored protein
MPAMGKGKGTLRIIRDRRTRLQDSQWSDLLGTNAYFFEEGTARRFVAARYGEFRLDLRSGEAVLVGMRDENLRRL